MWVREAAGRVESGKTSTACLVQAVARPPAVAPHVSLSLSLLPPSLALSLTPPLSLSLLLHSPSLSHPPPPSLSLFGTVLLDSKEDTS